MEKKVWKKSPQKLIDLFYEMMTGVPGADLKKMFGYPCAFLNGNMFVGLHQEDLVLRLSEKDREEVFAKNEGVVFAPMVGRVMREYVVLTEQIIYSNKKRIKELIGRSLSFAQSLPVKEKKKRG